MKETPKGRRPPCCVYPCFRVAETAHQLLAGNIFVIRQEVALGGLSGEVDEDMLASAVMPATAQIMLL